MRETDINLSEERSAAISSMRGAAQRRLPGTAEGEAGRALSEWSRDPQSLRVLAESERKLGETEEGQKQIRLAQTNWSDSVEKLPRSLLLRICASAVPKELSERHPSNVEPACFCKPEQVGLNRGE
jgi:hypothetical protein